MKFESVSEFKNNQQPRASVLFRTFFEFPFEGPNKNYGPYRMQIVLQTDKGRPLCDIQLTLDETF